MDAADLAEWMAYFMLQDDDTMKRLKLELKGEQSQNEINNNLRKFLAHVKGK